MLQEVDVFLDGRVDRDHFRARPRANVTLHLARPWLNDLAGQIDLRVLRDQLCRLGVEIEFDQRLGVAPLRAEETERRVGGIKADGSIVQVAERVALVERP